MDLRVLQHRAASNVNDLNFTGLRADVECLVEGAPDSAGELLLVLCRDLLHRFWSVVIAAALDHSGEVVNANHGHSLVHVDQEELLVAKTEAQGDLTVAWHSDGGGAGAIADVEDDDTLDGGSEDILGVLGHVEARAGRLDIELTSSDALVRVVHGNLAVIGAREK